MVIKKHVELYYDPQKCPTHVPAKIKLPEATMTDTEIKDKILYILTWLTGEKTILTNSLNKGEITQSGFTMQINNAIARAATEIKELL